MSKLTAEQFEAMLAHRNAFVEANPKACKTERSAERAWREQLTQAWLGDWREQWGTLRCVRNYVGIQAAFDSFAEMRSAAQK